MISYLFYVKVTSTMPEALTIRLIRHATLEICLAGRRLLVDPMLAEVGRYPSLTLFAYPARNPKVGLPYPVASLLDPHAVLVTHAHFDHFDATAHLPKDLPLICQPVDTAGFTRRGFTRVLPVEESGLQWGGLQVLCAGGRHGKGLVGRAMGTVSGFVLKAAGVPTVYVAGDTIWCSEVAEAIERHQPEVIIVNAGAAQFDLGGPITMTAADVASVCRAALQARIVAVHMEAINHCRLTRRALRSHLESEGLSDRVLIPRDGETLEFAIAGRL